MPMLADLERRYRSTVEFEDREGQDEVLVTDNRSRLSPAQLVEQKLRMVLQSGQYIAESLSYVRPNKPR